jgi:hypothetical protein
MAQQSSGEFASTDPTKAQDAGFQEPGRRNNLSRSTQQPTTSSMSNATSPQQERTESSGIGHANVA